MNVFAPVARLVSGRQKMKELICAALLTVPLVIAVAAHPPGWTAGGIAILATYLFALYYLAALHFTSDAAWDDIQRVVYLLGEHDLRSDQLPDEATVSSTNRPGRGRMGQLYRGAQGDARQPERDRGPGASQRRTSRAARPTSSPRAT